MDYGRAAPVLQIAYHITCTVYITGCEAYGLGCTQTQANDTCTVCLCGLS